MGKIGPAYRGQGYGASITNLPEFRAAALGLQVGDSVRIEVGRATGAYRTAFVVPQLAAPVVRIEAIPDATDQQRRLRTAWLGGR